MDLVYFISLFIFIYFLFSFIFYYQPQDEHIVIRIGLNEGSTDYW